MNARIGSNTIVRIAMMTVGVVLVGGTAVYFFRDRIFLSFYAPTETKLFQGVTENEVDDEAEVKDIEVIAEGLAIPWEIAFLPDGDILVTERPGTLKKIGSDGIIITIEGVEHIGEGGLLGMALHPDFEKTRWLFLYFTTKRGDALINRVERYRFDGNRLFEKTTIIDGIPGAVYHDGGRIAFGPASVPVGTSAGRPDYYLYITTGDAGNSNLAQDTRSLAGKILRLRDDGSIPEDNPFGNAVWSYGHRNPQGIVWDDTGRLWATEHGRSGILSGLDELNFIEKGENYGWPTIQGDERREGIRSPVIHSGPDETWAPAGAVYMDGSIFFAGLRGESIYKARISQDGGVSSVTNHFRGKFGRLRAIQIGRDGFLYITTSNTDGRGEIRPGDDKIIRINPEIF